MSLRFQALCDGCGAAHDRGPENKEVDVMTAREHAAQCGWTRNDTSGHDFCPSCSNQPTFRRPTRGMVIG